MSEKKEENQKPDFIKWFSELDKNSGKIAGGKGANLAEIYNLKLPVPPGFVITAQAYDYFIKKAGISEKIKEILSTIDYENTKQLTEATQKIRELITKPKIPKEMEDEIIDAYEALDIEKTSKDQDYSYKDTALDILKKSQEPVFVAVRSSATTEDLAEASFAGQQESFLNVKGNQDLLKHIKMCFASLFTARAAYYRNNQGFKDVETSLAVIIQRMIDSDKSGVIFSKDPSYNNEDIIIEAVWGLGEGIVSGKITPDKYIINAELKIKDKKISDKKIAITRDSGGGKTTVKLTESRAKSQVLTDYEIRKLADYAIKLEEHYQKPQDIEFAIENDQIYLVQTRPITTLKKRVDLSSLAEVKGELILTGMPASPGIAFGKVKIVHNLNELSKIKRGDIFVTEMTNPDMVVEMQKSAAIVTDEGGMTAHAAIVSREIGIPCIVGTQEATEKLKEGEIITVDGFTGKVYKGKTSEEVKKEVLPVEAETKTKIKLIVDLPSSAPRAAKTKIPYVGLTRIEGIIAESGKHPIYFLKNKKLQDYEEVIEKGIDAISKYFEELWIRTSDIRSDEYSNLQGAPKDIELNPMLGMHGIRFSLKNPEIFKAELNALKKVSRHNKKIGIMLPQVISVEEVKKTKEILKEIGFIGAKLGVMIETPAAVQIIEDLCIEGIEFISFGTNDLTQFTLALDRGNQEVQYLYDEMHPSILNQIKHVISICKKHNIETSICGQAGSKKEMVKFLVEAGIDSISVNADSASEIANYILELEKHHKKIKEEDEIYKTSKIHQEHKEIEMPIKYTPGRGIEPDIEKFQEIKTELIEKQVQEITPVPNLEKEIEDIEKGLKHTAEEIEKQLKEQNEPHKSDVEIFENVKEKLDEGIKTIEEIVEALEKKETPKELENPMVSETVVEEIKENLNKGIEPVEKIAEKVEDAFEPDKNEFYKGGEIETLPELEETETIAEILEEAKENEKGYKNNNNEHSKNKENRKETEKQIKEEVESAEEELLDIF
ncbi:MAG: phosphoenolpyruvate synthase [Nanoarchaeota archaeon]